MKEAWKKLSKQVIQDSFKVCGMTVAVDGTEDDSISCMKEGRPAAAAKPAFLTASQALLESEDDSTDPFADLDTEPEDDYTTPSDTNRSRVVDILADSSDDEDFVGF